MTFDIKKLSTAFVVVSLMVAKVAATEAPAADAEENHATAVLRATNVFYNLFATNALVAGRISTVGSLTAGSVHVDGDTTVNGRLVVNGSETVVGGETVNGPFTQYNGAVNISNDGIGSAINIGNTPTATGATISLGASSSTGANTINIGTATSTGANDVNIGNTNAAAGVVVQAGTTAKFLYNVGAVAGTNYALIPVGTASNEFVTSPQRIIHATIGTGGAVSATSGVANGPAGQNGHFGITWNNTFAVAPAVVGSVTGGTGTLIITSSTTGAIIDTQSNTGLASTNTGFYLIGVGQ